MSSISQAGYGSRLQNSIDLLNILKTYTLYNPVPTVIKIAEYEVFLASSQTALSDYNKLSKISRDTENVVGEHFVQLDELTRKIRNFLLEIYGKNETYADYNETIDIITGDNVTKNFLKRKKELAANPPPEGAPVEDFQSVSQQDMGAKLAKFIALVDALESDPQYTPNEIELKIPSLRTFIATISAKLQEYYTAESNRTLKQSEIETTFDGPDGLHSRAERAKIHVKRIYGVNSNEYKALTGKYY